MFLESQEILNECEKKTELVFSTSSYPSGTTNNLISEMNPDGNDFFVGHPNSKWNEIKQEQSCKRLFREDNQGFVNNPITNNWLSVNVTSQIMGSLEIQIVNPKVYRDEESHKHIRVTMYVKDDDALPDPYGNIVISDQIDERDIDLVMDQAR